MKRNEFVLLGISVELYEQLFNEKLVFDDELETPAASNTVETPNSMQFKNMKEAAKFLVSKCGLNFASALDGLYKTKRRGATKTHGYSVKFNNDKTIVLSLVA